MNLNDTTTETSKLVHDLRTPLTAIIGLSATLLRDDVNWSEEEKKDFIETIHDEANHLSNLLDGLLKRH